MRRRLLDLYCGAGGASVGYWRAGFDVTGVDIDAQPHYPFAFEQADALTFELDGYDAIHASPPCQAYSVASVAQRGQGVVFPDLVAQTRDRLDASGVPWIIENVPGAPIRPDFRICGCMFGLPYLRRERWFETSWNGFALRPPCFHDRPALSVTGHGVGAGNGQRGRFKAHAGHLPTTADARRAMGIDWMTRAELSQAIPPDYTEHLGALLLAYIEQAA